MILFDFIQYFNSEVSNFLYFYLRLSCRFHSFELPVPIILMTPSLGGLFSSSLVDYVSSIFRISLVSKYTTQSCEMFFFLSYPRCSSFVQNADIQYLQNSYRLKLFDILESCNRYLHMLISIPQENCQNRIRQSLVPGGVTYSLLMAYSSFAKNVEQFTNNIHRCTATCKFTKIKLVVTFVIQF